MRVKKSKKGKYIYWIIGASVIGVFTFVTTDIFSFKTEATGLNEAELTIEESALENFERVINLIDDGSMSIKVEEQMLEVSNELQNGNLVWTVTNQNKFDVVYSWRHVSTGDDGVSETVYAQGNGELSNSKSSFFTTPTNKNGKVVIEWLDENGEQQTMVFGEPSNLK
ncbi:hypothetical protein V7111_24990 [Neobacillus niacini]|uniref:hypothetical protein n=1 Tax=Neobacillus niacini TaxID=86668 RepID=UPI003002921C